MPAFLIIQLHLQDVTLEASSLYKKLLNYMQQVTMLMKAYFVLPSKKLHCSYSYSTSIN